MTQPIRPVFVTGAAGQLGRQIVENLMAREGLAPSDIIAGTRDPAKLADFAARGVQVRRVDFDDAASMDAAFKGVGALLIISTDAMDKPRSVQHASAIDAAKRAGAKHILYTSFVGAADDSPAGVAPDHVATEKALAASGVPYTFLRHGLYMDNLMWSLPGALAHGGLATAAGEGRAADVSRADCARADAAALASAGSDSRILNITGPEAVTKAEIAAIAADVAGKPLPVAHLSPEALEAAMTGAGLPAVVARLMTSFDEAIRDGFHAIRSNSVEKLTGQAPQSMAEFLKGQKAALSA